MENFNQKNNFESEIEEQRGANITSLVGGAKDFKSLSSSLKRAFKDMEVAIGLNKNPIMLGKKPLTKAEDIFTALKDGTLTSSKELGRIEKGLLKSSSTDPILRKTIAVDFAKDKNVLAELTKMNRSTTPEIKGYLKSKGYPDESIKEIIAQMKSNGAIDAKGLLSKNAANVSKTGGKTSKSLLTRTKELLNNIKIKKMSWKQLLIWGAGIGISGYALWYFIKETSDVIPDDMPTTPPSQDWGPCLTSMLQNKEAQLTTSKSGEIGVTTPVSDKYPNGLRFYSTGRVMNIQSREMGTWTCTAGQAQKNESISQIVKRVLSERFLMEQSTTQIDSDVEKMIDFLDFPVTQSDLQKALNLLRQYSTSPQVKEFLSSYEDAGILSTSLRTSLSMVYTTSAASARLKRELNALLDQIESGKVVPSTSTYVPSEPSSKTNTTKQLPKRVKIIGEQSEEGELKIVWDKDKKSGGDGGNTGGGTTSTKKTYYDCTNVNIDTTPLTYGCKSSKIAEIQKCLGVGVDGKFGPNTRKALIGKSYDVSNGITKDIYTKVLAACNPSASQTAGSTEGGADVNYLRNPIKLNLGPVPQMPSKNNTSSNFNQPTDTVTKTLSPTNESGQNFYNRLEGNGNFEDGKFGDNRARYKGNNLNDEDLGKLDEFFRANGYERERGRIQKPYGEKYVWIKQ
jgi:hypothetical protein